MFLCARSRLLFTAEIPRRSWRAAACVHRRRRVWIYAQRELYFFLPPRSSSFLLASIQPLLCRFRRCERRDTRKKNRGGNSLDVFSLPPEPRSSSLETHCVAQVWCFLSAADPGLTAHINSEPRSWEILFFLIYLSCKNNKTRGVAFSVRAVAGCWVLCWNGTGREKGTLFHSFFSLAATTPVDLDGVCVCFFFLVPPINSARTFTRGILASDPLGGGGVTPSWWCRIIATFRHIFPLFWHFFKGKRGEGFFFCITRPDRTAVRALLFSRDGDRRWGLPSSIR